MREEREPQEVGKLELKNIEGDKSFTNIRRENIDKLKDWTLKGGYNFERGYSLCIGTGLLSSIKQLFKVQVFLSLLSSYFEYGPLKIYS